MSLKRIWTTLAVILLLMALGQTLVFAQDDTDNTDTSSAEATPTPTPTTSAEETLLERLRRILGEDIPESTAGNSGGGATTGGDTSGDTTASPTPYPTRTPVPPSPDAWRGQYFNNGELRGGPVANRQDNQISFNWGGGSPFPQVPVDGFSARWTKNFGVLERGFNNVTISTDFGARVYVNDYLLINHEGGPRNMGASFWTDGDENINIRVEYRHDSGQSYFTFRMSNSAPISSAPFGRATVINGTPALSDGPGEAYWSNGRVAIGQTLILTGHRTEAGNWVCVVTEDGVVGWVNTYYLQSSTTFGTLQVWPMNFPGPEPDSTVRPDVEVLRIRYGPGAQYPAFDSADPGERLVLVGRNETNDWLLIRKWDGALGWAYADYLNVNYNIPDLPVRWLE